MRIITTSSSRAFASCLYATAVYYFLICHDASRSRKRVVSGFAVAGSRGLAAAAVSSRASMILTEYYHRVAQFTPSVIPWQMF